MIEQLVNAIVRPPKREYTIQELDNISLSATENSSYSRTDFFVTNPRGHNLQASLWSDTNKSHAVKYQDCCLIYMHPNSGNRMDMIRSRGIIIFM